MSVCPSQTCVLSKSLNRSSWFRHRGYIRLILHGVIREFVYQKSKLLLTWTLSRTLKLADSSAFFSTATATSATVVAFITITARLSLQHVHPCNDWGLLNAVVCISIHRYALIVACCPLVSHDTIEYIRAIKT